MAEGKLQQATFGAGCFWCTEAVFKRLEGVEKVVVGYAGGKVPHPTYEQVSSGKTGHIETAQVTFDADKVSYAQLLNVFWVVHDPTSSDRQGADVGTQYRSAVFYHTQEQRLVAEASLKEAQVHFKDPIVTKILPLEEFWSAEDYHQDYYAKNPDKPYCRAVIDPKVAKVKEIFRDKLRN